MTHDLVTTAFTLEATAGDGRRRNVYKNLDADNYFAKRPSVIAAALDRRLRGIAE